jgi:adenylate cyclase
MEIERKFLVDDPPDLKGRDGDEIEQGYLAIADEGGGAEVRLRRRANATLLTVKSAGGRTRVEEEIELDRERFESLWKLTDGRRLTKTRYVLDHGEREIELDVYSGDLASLIVAEVEFPDQGSAEAFEPPPWFGNEVTTNQDFRNAALATRGLPR